MYKETKPNANWFKVQNWMLDKVATSEGGPDSLNEEMLQPRSKPQMDYQVVLENASRSMIRFKKPEHLIRMIVQVIDEEVKTSHTAVLLYKKEKNSFVLIDSKGGEGLKIPVNFIRMAFDSPLIKLFNARQNYIVSDTGTLCHAEIKELLKNQDALKRYPELAELIELASKQMELLKAEICIPFYYKKDLIGVLILGAKMNRHKYTRQEIGFFMTLANDAAMALANAQLIQDLKVKVDEVKGLYEREHKIFLHTAVALAAAIDARDPYTHGHTERVTRYCLAVADEIEDIPEAKAYKNFRETLHIAALLHDVGKIGCPDDILKKKDKLTRKERKKVEEHPIIGAAILTPIRELSDIAKEIKCHQERYDGKGYPDGLRGTDIPLVARIIAVCDTFDAIVTDRPYRQRKMTEFAVQEIKDGSGTQFDPIVVGAFLLAFEKGKIVLPASK